MALNTAAAAPLAAVSVPGIYDQLDQRGRGDVPARDQLPGRGPAPGLRGVLAQLLRPARTRCPPPSWPPCSTSTSWAPARAWCSTCPTPGSTSPCGTRCSDTWPPATSRSAPAPTSPGSSPAGRGASGCTPAAARSTPTRWCWPPTSAACAPSSAGSPGLADPAWRDQVGGAAHRAAVPGPAALAGPAGRPGPAGVPGHRRPGPAGQHQRAGPLRPARPGTGPRPTAARWSNCTPTPPPVTRPPRPARRCSAHHGPAARAVPGDGRGPVAGRVGAVARRLPDVRRR